MLFHPLPFMVQTELQNYDFRHNFSKSIVDQSGQQTLEGPENPGFSLPLEKYPGKP